MAPFANSDVPVGICRLSARRPMMPSLNIGAVKKNIQEQGKDALTRVSVTALKGDRREIAREFHMLDDLRKPQRPSKSAPHFNPAKDYCQSVMPQTENMAETLDGDYINASIIDGIAGHNYIAAQGPLDGTVEDFWSMIVKSHVKQIVALCSDDECADYLPSEDEPLTLRGGALRVRSLGDEAVSTIDNLWLTRLEVSYGEDTWEVERLHCSQWADFGILPAATLLSIAEKVNVAGKNATTLVHCRAGAGRTGCLLAVCSLLAEIDTQTKKVPGETCVSVARTVVDLRSRRPHMVQSLEQYEAIYQAMSEWSSKRGTEEDEDVSTIVGKCCRLRAGHGDTHSLREC